jgi:hypothetical protein
VAHPRLGRADVLGDPREQLIGSLDNGAVLAREVASAEDRERIVGERRQHIRTVRSAARARNRPRRWLAWFLLAIVLVLIAVAARANAKPADDSIALAIRYANILTGVERDGDAGGDDPRAEADDRDLHDDAESRDAEGRDAEGRDGGGRDAAGRDAAGRDAAGRDVDGDDADRADDLDATGDRGEPPAEDDRHEDLFAGTDLDGASLEDLVIGVSVPHDDDPAHPRTAADAVAGDATAVADAADDLAALSDLAAASLIDAASAQPGTPGEDDAIAATTGAGASEIYESRVRDRRSPRWGHLDVGIEWQRRERDPLHTPAYRVDEIWLVATWRR